MAAVKQGSTNPEMVVRRLLHRKGYRYRLHAADLPGTPDIAFKKRKKVILVHGCFWHGHDCAHGRRQPRTNREYWCAKIERNRRRDARVVHELESSGWQVLTVWECETGGTDELSERLVKFLQ